MNCRKLHGPHQLKEISKYGMEILQRFNLRMARCQQKSLLGFNQTIILFLLSVTTATKTSYKNYKHLPRSLTNFTLIFVMLLSTYLLHMHVHRVPTQCFVND